MKNPYRKEKLTEFHKEILKIETHVPKMERLIVVGQNKHNLPQNRESQTLTDTFNSQPEEVIKTEDYTTYVEEKIRCDENIVMSLQIEEHTFTKNEVQPKIEHVVMVNYAVGRDDIITKTIKIKNVGTAAIKYQWCRKIPFKILPDLIPHRVIECRFIFKKSISVILPNDECCLQIFFATDKPGYNREIWELNTEPNIFTQGSFSLILCYCADEINLTAAQEAILKRLDDGIKEDAVNDIIVSLIHNASQNKEREAKPVIITEKDIFEAINAEFQPPGIESIPKIVHYERSLVEELKLFYERIKVDVDVEGLDTWNYKIKELYDIVHEVREAKKREGYLTVLRAIDEQFSRTKMIENVKHYKYNSIYLMMQNMIGRMTDHVFQYREMFKIPLIETYPYYDSKTSISISYNERGEYRTEKHFASIQKFNPNKKIDKCPVTNLRPSLEVLRNMPLDDIESRLILYNKIKQSVGGDKQVKAASSPTKEKKAKGKKAAAPKAKPVQKQAIPDPKLEIDPRKKKAERRSKIVRRPVEQLDYIEEEPRFERKDSGSDTRTICTEIEFKTEHFIIPTEDLGRHRIVVFPDYPDWHKDMNKVSSDSIDESPAYILSYEDGTRHNNSEYYCCVYNSIRAILSETIMEIDSFLSKIENDKKVARRVLRKCIECGIPTLKPNQETKSLKLDPETVKKLLEESLEMSFEAVHETASNIEANNEELSCGSSELNFNISSVESLQSGKIVECKDAETETACGSLYTPRVQVQNIQTDFDDDEFDLVALIERELSATSINYIKVPTEDKSVQFDDCQLCESDSL